MEYCGGGDLSSVIKQAGKSGRGIPEESIWAYFMQILKALCHCHHPNGILGGGNGGGGQGGGNGAGGEVQGHRRTGSSGAQGEEGRRPQILHRDLKPDNGTSTFVLRFRII